MLTLAYTDLNIFYALGLSSVWLFFSAIMAMVMVKLIDKIFFPKICFSDELKNGNVAVSILMGAVVIALALITQVAIS
jgi:hypothetical protein